MIRCRNRLPWRPLQLLVRYSSAVIDEEFFRRNGRLCCRERDEGCPEARQARVGAHTRLAPRHQRNPCIILSPLWKSRTARGIAPAPQHEIAPAPRARPHLVQLPRLAPRPRGCIRWNRGTNSAVEARVLLPIAVGCSKSCHSE